MLPSLEVYHDFVPRSAAMNMAIDEILWHSAETPRLRFYRWGQPALSFGYFGHYGDVAAYSDERDIVRRCTGGGIVFHGADLTYALVIPGTQLAGLKSPLAIYHFAHEAMHQAFAESGLATTLAPTPDRKRLGIANETSANPCFANPVASDVMIGHEKVAGAAQRRSRRGLLQQGSIQNVPLPPEFTARFAENLSSKIVSGTLDPNQLRDANSLAQTKYATKEWLQRY